MSIQLDARAAEQGTRFRIFPQPLYVEGFDRAELIYVNVSRGEVQPGPADSRMYVIDAINKRPYRHPYLPPHTGDHNQHRGQAIPDRCEDL